MMAAASLLASLNLQSYFDNPKYSDVTIRFSGKEIKAHKLVLAQGSEYFKVLFDSSFKEASSSHVNLKDDNPTSVAALIASLYTIDFVGFLERYSRFNDQPEVISCRKTHELNYYVDLYVTASKYLVPFLCTGIADKFKSKLNLSVLDVETPKLFETGYPGYTGTVVKHVYVDHREAAVMLRKVIVDWLVLNIRNFKALEQFQKLLIDIPELSLELLLALADDRERVPRESSTNCTSHPSCSQPTRGIAKRRGH